MKKLITILSVLVIMASSGYAQDNYPNTTAKSESPIGTLEYRGGFPTQSTIDSAFDQLDRQRATQAYLEFMPMTSVNSIFEAHIQGLRLDGLQAIFRSILSLEQESQVPLDSPTIPRAFMLRPIRT